MLPASAALASCGHLRLCKLPWMQVCFLGLRAFSTLWQSVDFVNILGERACTAPPFAIFRGCAARAEKALAFFRALWYTIPCSTGDDDRVPCGVMLRIVSGPEGSSTKQKLARAAGYAWFESVGFFMHDSSPRSARDFGPSKRGLFYTLQRQKTRRNVPAGIQTKRSLALGELGRATGGIQAVFQSSER